MQTRSGAICSLVEQGTDLEMSTQRITTSVTAKLPAREGEVAFTRAAVTKAPDGRLMVELGDEEGHVVNIAFHKSDLKTLISWRLLMGF
jgi:hypothetical protein